MCTLAAKTTLAHATVAAKDGKQASGAFLSFSFPFRLSIPSFRSSITITPLHHSLLETNPLVNASTDVNITMHPHTPPLTSLSPRSYGLGMMNFTSMRWGFEREGLYYGHNGLTYGFGSQSGYNYDLGFSATWYVLRSYDTCVLCVLCMYGVLYVLCVLCVLCMYGVLYVLYVLYVLCVLCVYRAYGVYGARVCVLECGMRTILKCVYRPRSLLTMRPRLSTPRVNNFETWIGPHAGSSQNELYTTLCAVVRKYRAAAKARAQMLSIP